MADLKSRNVNLDGRGNLIRRADDVECMGDDIDRATALHAGRLLDIDHVDRDAHPDGGALPEPHEIDVGRVIHDRVDLEVARDDAKLRSIDVEVIEGGEEVTGEDALLELRRIERDRHGVLEVAVNDARHAAGATHGPCGPLAACRTRRRLEFPDGGHG